MQRAATRPPRRRRARSGMSGALHSSSSWTGCGTRCRWAPAGATGLRCCSVLCARVRQLPRPPCDHRLLCRLQAGEPGQPSSSALEQEEEQLRDLAAELEALAAQLNQVRWQGGVVTGATVAMHSLAWRRRQPQTCCDTPQPGPTCCAQDVLNSARSARSAAATAAPYRRQASSSLAAAGEQQEEGGAADSCCTPAMATFQQRLAPLQVRPASPAQHLLAEAASPLASDCATYQLDSSPQHAAPAWSPKPTVASLAGLYSQPDSLAGSPGQAATPATLGRMLRESASGGGEGLGSHFSQALATYQEQQQVQKAAADSSSKDRSVLRRRDRNDSSMQPQAEQQQQSSTKHEQLAQKSQQGCAAPAQRAASAPARPAALRRKVPRPPTPTSTAAAGDFRLAAFKPAAEGGSASLNGTPRHPSPTGVLPAAASGGQKAGWRVMAITAILTSRGFVMPLLLRRPGPAERIADPQAARRLEPCGHPQAERLVAGQHAAARLGRQRPRELHPLPQEGAGLMRL